jgi:Pentapeptide repeats (8 copies)
MARTARLGSGVLDTADGTASGAHRIWYVLGGTLLIAALLFLCIFVLPARIYPPLNMPDLAGVSSAKDRVELQQSRLQLQNNVRTALLQGLVATFFVVTAYFSWQQLLHSNRQLSLARRGQITERFTKAVEQLGDDSSDIRIGGVFGLSQIAEETSGYDREAVAQVLIGFIRSRAPWPPTRPGQYVADAPIEDVPTLRSRAFDVQTALTALATNVFASAGDITEGTLARSSSRRQLSAVDLRRANLWSAYLAGYWLEGTNLHAAGIRNADLRRTNLQDACLRDANLRGADLRGANLQGASLHGADLTGARIGSPTPEAPESRGVRSSYWLPSTDPDSQTTRLVGASADSRTLWPAGFDTAEAGVLMESS